MKIIPKLQKGGWIPSRGPSGEYGWINIQTGQFTTVDPTTKQKAPTVQQSTTVKKPVVHKAKKQADIAAERAVREREKRAQMGQAAYDTQKDKEQTEYAIAQSQEKPTTTKIADAIDTGVGFVPFVSDAYDATKATSEAAKGNYTTAGAIGLGLAVPNALEKPVKFLLKFPFARKIRDEIVKKKYHLPSYVNFERGRTHEPVDLHMERLKNGGYDALPETDEWGNYYFKDDDDGFIYLYKNPTNDFVLNDFNSHESRAIKNSIHDQMNASLYHDGNDYWGNLDLVKKDANVPEYSAFNGSGNVYIGKGAKKHFGYNDKQDNRVISHEVDHAYHTPIKHVRGVNEAKTGHFTYFYNLNGTEYAARGSQLKDWFGLTRPDQEITPEMLKFAEKYYVEDTGLDNNMTDMFRSILDYKSLAKWLSENSTAIAIPTTIAVGGYALQKNQNNQVK